MQISEKKLKGKRETGVVTAGELHELQENRSQIFEEAPKHRFQNI